MERRGREWTEEERLLGGGGWEEEMKEKMAGGLWVAGLEG